jgi:hypothetical protein
MKSLSPDEFRDRVLYWIDKHLEDSPKGGGFIDLEVKEIIFQGPEKVTEIIIDRLDALCKIKQVPYLPDEVDDPVALYISTLLESSRLIRLLKTEGYSDKTREILSHALNTLARFSKPEISYQNPGWQKEYSTFIQAVGTFLYITQFLIQKSDGEYENAMKSLAGGIVYYITADFKSFDRTKKGITEPSLVEFMNYMTNYPQELPWIQALEPQIPVDCFEALRKGERILDPKNIAAICGLFATTYSNWWILDEDENEVKDADGNEWKVIDFWHHASGWLEARLQPSDLRELLNEREDSASEKRLRTYFFGDELWAKLPERAKCSLISADRDWFGGSLARTEAVLNELKIATEELMHNGLWKPLEQWLEVQGSKHRDLQDFLNLKAQLAEKRRLPTILDLERICRMSVTGAFLAENGVPLKERQWFIKELPRSLHHLRKARNRAEHESLGNWARQEIAGFVAEFIGIGRPGVLPQLAKVLFQEKHLELKKST